MHSASPSYDVVVPPAAECLRPQDSASTDVCVWLTWMTTCLIFFMLATHLVSGFAFVWKLCNACNHAYKFFQVLLRSRFRRAFFVLALWLALGPPLLSCIAFLGRDFAVSLFLTRRPVRQVVPARWIGQRRWRCRCLRAQTFMVDIASLRDMAVARPTPCTHILAKRVVSRKHPGVSAAQCFVRSLTGATHVCSFAASGSVQDLCNAVACATGIPSHLLYLTRCGSPVSPTALCHQVGIVDGITLEQRARLRGGTKPKANRTRSDSGSRRVMRPSPSAPAVRAHAAAPALIRGLTFSPVHLLLMLK